LTGTEPLKPAFQRDRPAFENAGFSAIFSRAMYLCRARDSDVFLV
jgi:hypothetical protein